MTTQPTVGTQTKFFKIDGEGKVIEGEGTIIAVFIDASRVLCATIKPTEGHNVNVYAALLNANDEKKQAFINTHAEIQELEKAAADENKDLVKRYNAKIDAKYDEVLGARMVVAETTEATL